MKDCRELEWSKVVVVNGGSPYHGIHDHRACGVSRSQSMAPYASNASGTLRQIGRDDSRQGPRWQCWQSLTRW